MSVRLAQLSESEILSADSRQFYRELRIGTAMPDPEELAAVPHHFIGHLSIHDAYNVSAYEQDALKKLEELFGHHDILFLTGGSGLYIDAVCKGIDNLPDPDPALRENLHERLRLNGIADLQNELQKLDPEYFQKVDRQNPVRLIRALEVCLTTGKTYSSQRSGKQQSRPFHVIKTGLDLPKEDLISRIKARTDSMLAHGLEAEAREVFPYRQLNALNTVGYKEMFQYFEKRYTLEEAREKIITNTWRYAKRQLTWFRRDPEIHWFQDSRPEEIIKWIRQMQNNH